MNKLASICIWVTCIIIGLIGLVFCGFIYPFGTMLSTLGFMDIEYATPTQDVWFYSELIFYWVVSLPCFVVLVLMIIFSVFVWKGKWCCAKARKLLKTCAWILLIDTIVYLIGNLILDYFNQNDFFKVYYGYYVVTVLGFIGAFIFGWLAHCASKRGQQTDSYIKKISF